MRVKGLIIGERNKGDGRPELIAIEKDKHDALTKFRNLECGRAPDQFKWMELHFIAGKGRHHVAAK